ncbi:hypothetical protein GCM10010080_30490 [Thermomonas carbonis]|nr:hypothetical protein GCM10010080_30490 [Thermomonas carbonis]
MPVNKRQAKLVFDLSLPAQAFDLRHKLRAGKNAGTPFLGSAFRKERSSVLDLAQVMGSWSKATAGTVVQVLLDFHPHKAAKRSVLTQALGLQENIAYRDVVLTTGDMPWSK